MAGDVKRGVRVAERLREEMALLLGRDVRDPRVAGTIVARVQMPDDLRSAKIFFRLLEGGERLERRESALEGLTRASGMLRREITQRLSLRYAPELRFVYDEGQEKLQRIEELLFEVREGVDRGASDTIPNREVAKKPATRPAQKSAKKSGASARSGNASASARAAKTATKTAARSAKGPARPSDKYPPDARKRAR